MTTVEYTASLSCGKCGTKGVNIEDKENDESLVFCKNPDCETTFGTWGEVKARARSAAAMQAKDDVRAAFRKAFKKP
ncbi:hypothetical protein [Ochrobactrum sp. BTU1]|uniref:hypothetical protein n=1 Tax=Ochrobactrum sp. BTU1 TaxID=2840456 RepID=UPI001C058816|nr:hypothetical protein KMS41_14145 [Ochrobactrum sp. BTU1]